MTETEIKAKMFDVGEEMKKIQAEAEATLKRLQTEWQALAKELEEAK